MLHLTIILGLAVVSFAMMPEAFSDNSVVVIEQVAGSGIAGCQDDGGCYTPMVATVDVGGVVIFQNTDNVAHTFTAGTVEDGPSGVFDSGLALIDTSFEYKADTIGEIPHFYIVHPWMTGLIVVQAHTTLTGTVFSDDNGNGVQDTGEAGIPGLVVLYVDLSDNSKTAKVTTDANGIYDFDGL